MKSKYDPRHQKRIKLIQALFAWGLNGHKSNKILDPVVSHLGDIDQLIVSAAPKWPLDQVNQIDLAILRYAAWELQNSTDTPPKVVIDEAIEIAKEYGNESSQSFVNAVLGHIYKQKNA